MVELQCCSCRSTYAWNSKLLGADGSEFVSAEVFCALLEDGAFHINALTFLAVYLYTIRQALRHVKLLPFPAILVVSDRKLNSHLEPGEVMPWCAEFDVDYHDQLGMLGN